MNSSLENTSLIDGLHWRYATKKMNGERVPEEKLSYILEAARLAPSSSGLQPYRIFVVRDRAVLEQLKGAAFGQSQITDCSELLVWAVQDRYTQEGLGNVLKRTATERSLPEDSMAEYSQRLWGMYGGQTPEEHQAHAARQAYLSLGLAIAAAAEQKVDATPMEGFVPAQFDQILGLDRQGLKSVVILPVGYRDAANDWLVTMKKVRTPEAEFVNYV